MMSDEEYEKPNGEYEKGLAHLQFMKGAILKLSLHFNVLEISSLLGKAGWHEIDAALFIITTLEQPIDEQNKCLAVFKNGNDSVEPVMIKAFSKIDTDKKPYMFVDMVQ